MALIKVLVTGGAGFIGSNFVRYALQTHADWHVTTLDKLTYAGRKENLHDVMDNPRHTFVHGDILDAAVAGPLVEASDYVVHFAAETHVDRSIMAAGEFIKTDVEGSFVLLEAARRNPNLKRFIQISTDEVYGSVPEGSSTETDELKPRNPYAASKAGADRLAYSYFATHDVPVIITRASNNYGPYQFPEKLIPLMILNAVEGRPLPIYGDGLNVRDWLYVRDHCSAIREVLSRGRVGETYNVGGWNEKTNREIVLAICNLLDELRPSAEGSYQRLIHFVTDRPGHDRRYAIDARKIERELGWRPQETFESGIQKTVQWYLDHADWVADVTSGAYRDWVTRQYG